MRRIARIFTVVLLTAACGPTPQHPIDAAPHPDAPTGADAPTSADGPTGVDAPPAIDAKPAIDAPPPVDAGPPDATPVSCMDAIKNGMETDVDCGGPMCPRCTTSKTCLVGTDCIDGVCDPTTLTCSAALCNDMVKNGTETDLDCGGAVCMPCSPGLGCVSATDCTTGVCGATMTCQPATCMDGVKNGLETDLDCGGGTCPGCAAGQGCNVNGDCVGGSCIGLTCAPTCTDGAKNAAETDVDCGGGTCASCASGKACLVNADCASGSCSGATCVDVVLISEVRTRGAGGASDELVELYNPTSIAVTLDATWTIDARSTTAASYTGRWTGSGAVLPAHGHYLITGSTYAGAVASDAALTSGITDASSIRLKHGGVTADALCLQYDATTLAAYDATYTCEGTPMSNLPHNNGTSMASNSDASVERKPGGAAGNGQDTNDNLTDFLPSAPANPQDLASPVAP